MSKAGKVGEVNYNWNKFEKKVIQGDVVLAMNDCTESSYIEVEQNLELTEEYETNDDDTTYQGCLVNV